jgi:hypothetical protein
MIYLPSSQVLQFNSGCCQTNSQPPPSGSKSKPSKKQASSTNLCCLLFDCEDVGDIFFEVIGYYQTALCYNPEDYTFCGHCDDREGEEGIILKRIIHE